MSKKDLWPSKPGASFPGWALVWLFILATLTGVVPGPAAANDPPKISGTTATYSGNQQPDPIAQNNTDIYNIVVNSLTTDVGSSSTDTAISLTNQGTSGSQWGEPGKNSQALSLNYSAGNYYLYGDNYGVYLSTTGGFGYAGDSHSGVGHKYGDDGATGGTGGNINIPPSGGASSGAIEVSGIGLGAYSTGGAGGDGGSGSGTEHSTGGDGGVAGAGGTVWVTTNGAITTSGMNSSGANAYGIDAQSKGGAGGAGGEGDGAGMSGDGGAGGRGGASGSVTVTNNAAVTLTGDSTSNCWFGINALSTGGNGGQGGTSDGGTQDGQAGAGGGGGAAGEVTVTCNAAVNTLGAAFIAVNAASIGGNGGSGGTCKKEGTGGQGGSGGDSGQVGVTVAPGVTLNGGIWAQSIAGAGGAGGGSNGSGGDGGNGAPGGSVTVTCNGNINIGSEGPTIEGILAQGWGGAGGAGGTGKTAGSGGQSGVGGAVTVNLGGSIQIESLYSYGILAQSLGGAGGNSGGTTRIITHSGDAGNGADGGAVTINTGSYAPGFVPGTNSSITTSLDLSTAICAQSVGGGGGTGDSTSGVIYSLGGSGGSGGTGATATVNNGSQVSTQGFGAHGIEAQSVGGGGGNAGGSVTEGVGFAIGGSGGTGGAGDQVNVLTTANAVSTAGDFAHGILAESIGGGGGNGGYAISGGGVLQVAIGGSGGSGGAGGEVNVGNMSDSGIITYCTSPISTSGFDAKGILAQSIGGGGGSGGYSIAAGVAGVPIAFGGSGATGGAGGVVNVYNAGAITTSQDLSQGIFAESVGGGGGNGGYSFAGNVTPLLSTSFSFGGSAAQGSAGEAVTVYNTGTIQTGSTSTQNGVTETQGVDAHGILAQSIGGSGGHGGWAGSGSASFSLGPDAPVSVSMSLSMGGKGGGGGAGGDVTVNNLAPTEGSSFISTLGDQACGILAQSIGGSGGAGGGSAAATVNLSGSGTFSLGCPITLGGLGGSGGAGGTVEVTNQNAIQTSGFYSMGIVAQSVGGGGGAGGNSMAASLSYSGSGSTSIDCPITLGGAGGSGGAGGEVTVTNQNTIQTSGVDSMGILAQSVGGGGGAGGNSMAASLSYSGSGSNSIDCPISLGGTGGSGGAGGDVTVHNLAPTEGSCFISTLGDFAYGILAQSIGGGGGHGGGSVTASLGLNSSGSFGIGGKVSVGGDGGSGGAGGEVTVTNQNAIQTSGCYSLGILAQSISGGGGDGGVSATGALSGAPAGSVSLKPQITVGGNGGDGSAGNTVTVTNTGAITTAGGSAIGIEAQSVGGIGGNGGWSFAADALLGKSSGVTATVTVGGTGGKGGDGNTVKVTNGQEGYADLGAIKTGGPMAHGILAQSLGGGGGNGGQAATFSLGKIDIGANTSINLNPIVTVGGHGGVAGHGGEAEVINYANITTKEYIWSCGIFAQSVGGGGGAGGSSHTINASTAATSGELTSFNMPSSNRTATVAVGGKGGDGSYGGTVSVTNTGRIVTQGFDSYGILAQSIGGSGGVGGAAYDFSMILALSKAGNKNNNASGLNINESVSVGGKGGTGSYGGAVTVTNSGAIYTLGSSSYGIFAQSVGGGGGVGGSSTTGLSVPSSNYNDWASWLIPSECQLTFEVGGNGGGSSNGGTVTVTNTGAITTLGNRAFGIYAQSLGGGGGVAHYDQCQMFTDSNSNGGQVGPSILPGTFEIGGKGGAGGDGETVTVNNSGAIHTCGNQASGIYAQSIGGGGGNGSIIGGPWNGIQYLQYFGFGIDMGRKGGTGGTGGTVSVTNTGDIITQGNNANGIFAQSVGGAGGSGSQSTQYFQGFLWNGSTATGVAGDGGTVTVSHTGNITTSGNDAHGIVAQSVAGKDTAGNVNVTLNANNSTATPGNIIASGFGTCGIAAQSLGQSANGTIEINIYQPSANTGLVQGGHSGTVTNADGYTMTYNAHGVLIMDGNNKNVVNNYGSISTLDGQTGTAVMVQADYGAPAWANLELNNYGTITGSVNQGTQAASSLTQGLSLPSGHSTITFNICEMGTYNAGPVINLGGGTLSNTGILALGTVQSTLTGYFINYDAAAKLYGTLQTTVNGDGTIGQLNVSETATLGGTLQVLKGTGPFQNGTSSPFLTGTITGNFANTILPAGTSLVDFSVQYTGASTQSANSGLAAAAAANGLRVVSHVKSYTTVASRPVDGVLGRHLDQLLAANATGSIAQVLAEFQRLAPAQFPAAFQSLHPTVYGANTDTTFSITRQYTRTLQQRLEALRAGRPEEAAPQARTADSPFPLLAYNGSNASLEQVLGQDQAAWNRGRLGVWLEGFGQWGNQASINGFSGYNYGLTGTGAGIDYRFTKNLILGANFGYSYTNLNLDNGFGGGRINSLYGSLYGTWFSERAYVDGILSYGHHQYDNSRLINIGALQSINQSSHSGNALALLVEGGYKFPVQHWNLTPFANLSYGNLSEGRVEESGGVATMQVKSRSNNSVVSELGVRVDRPIKTARGTLVPMVKASWQHDFGVSQNNLPIAFVGAPIGVTITNPRTSQDSAVVRAGLTFKAKGGVTSSIEYIGELGNQTQNQGVMGQIRLPF